MNSLNSFKTNKFKKGDKVICVGNTSALGVEFGEVYTVDNPSSHSGYYIGELHNHVTLVEVESTPSDKHLELYNHVILEEVESMPIDNHLVLCIEKRNYREMSPNDLITISINGIESEVPLGDIVHAVAILGVTNGYHGARIWEALRKPFCTEGFVQDMDTVVEFRDKQKEALEYFFKPYYDKQQEKDELKTLIASKMEEVDALVEQLNQLNQMQGIQMRTYNKGNTQNVKQARKQSKELRKLKSSRNTFIETNEVVKGQQNMHYYEDDYDACEGEC